jgi:hypothetical protein
MEAAISKAAPVCTPRFAIGFVIENFGALFKESSRQAQGLLSGLFSRLFQRCFIVVSVDAAIVFP